MVKLELNENIEVTTKKYRLDNPFDSNNISNLIDNIIKEVDKL